MKHEFARILAGAGKTGFRKNFFKVFMFLDLKVVLDIGVEITPNSKFWPRKNILYTILTVTSFSINYNKLTNHN